MGATVQAINSGDSWLTYGNRRAVLGTLTMSSSYATNGDTVTASGYGLTALDALLFMSQPAGYTLYFDKANLKVKAYRSAGFTPSGTNATSALSNGVAAAQTFTGGAASLTATGTAAITIAAHTHDLHFQETAAANAVTAQANQLRTATTAFSVVGVTTDTGEGGIVQTVATGTAATTITVGAYTPAGTNGTASVTGTAAAQTFTGAAVAATALVEVSNGVSLASVAADVQAIGA